jgi:hypothetical protein
VTYVKLLLPLVAAALSGCSTQSSDAGTVPPPVRESGVAVTSASYDVGVRAFQTVCIATAPSFDKAPDAAKSFGVSGLTPGKVSMEMSEDEKISVQLKPGKECAVTTEKRPGDAVAKQFVSAVATAAGADGKQMPLLGYVGGSAFMFLHDRNGGEAYVMMRR